MRIGIYYSIYSILLVFLLFTSITYGSFDTSLTDIYEAITAYEEGNPIHLAIIELRLPRVLMAFLVGGMLALSGYLMQLMVNNPLADPFILGTSSAASVGANLALLGFFSFLGIYSSVLMAFIMALGVTLLVVLISQNKGVIQPSKLLLGGIAISSLMTTIISLISYLSNSSNTLKTIVFWIMGSLEGANWTAVTIAFFTLVISCVYFFLKNNSLNLLLLGYDRATALGLDERKLRWEVLIGSSLLAAVGVAFTGPVGFVGLMVPHVVRALFGITYKFNIINTVLLGGIFVVLADLISKVWYPPMGLPIGLITSLFGVPFFVYLLSKKGYTFK